MKIKCVDCGKDVEVTEEEVKWKNRCKECFIKMKQKEESKEEPKSVQKQEPTENMNIRFGNCLNASGMALSGSTPSPEQHFAYAKVLYQLWNTKDDGQQEYVPEETLGNGKKG